MYPGSMISKDAGVRLMENFMMGRPATIHHGKEKKIRQQNINTGVSYGHQKKDSS